MRRFHAPTLTLAALLSVSVAFVACGEKSDLDSEREQAAAEILKNKAAGDGKIQTAETTTTDGSATRNAGTTQIEGTTETSGENTSIQAQCNRDRQGASEACIQEHRAQEEAVKEELGKKADLTNLTDEEKDLVSAGGQPGKVTLHGSFVGRDMSPAAQLDGVNPRGGTGWRGTEAKVTAGRPDIERSILPTDKQEIAKVQGGKLVVVGCDLESLSFSGMLDKKNAEMKSLTDISEIEAEQVALCGAIALKTGNILSIRTKKLFIKDLSLTLSGSDKSFVTILSTEWLIEGQNVMSMRGADGIATTLPGPGLKLVGALIDGSGRLRIESVGASYKTSAASEEVKPTPNAAANPETTTSIPTEDLKNDGAAGH